jgi:hypothetical protein
MACQRNQLIDTVEILSLTGNSVSVLRHDSCLPGPTAVCAPVRTPGPKGLFFKANGRVAGRRQRDLESYVESWVRVPLEVRKPYRTRGKALERLSVPQLPPIADGAGTKETAQGRQVRRAGDRASRPATSQARLRQITPARVRSCRLATDHEMIGAEVRGLECLERGAPEHEALGVDFAYGIDVGAERGVLENFEAHAGEHLSQ